MSNSWNDKARCAFAWAYENAVRAATPQLAVQFTRFIEIGYPPAIRVRLDYKLSDGVERQTTTRARFAVALPELLFREVDRQLMRSSRQF